MPLAPGGEGFQKAAIPLISLDASGMGSRGSLFLWLWV